jgi:acetolactate synthase-1/2/3 large subunit
MDTASAIVEILKKEGTEFLSCFPANRLIEAAAEGDLRPLICRQERVGIAIADGFSRISNGKRIGVFAMQQGPGAENAFPGVAQAYAESVPILLLPGGESRRRADVPPSFSAVRNYAGVVKWVAQVNFPDRVPEMMRRAFYLLRTGRPRPVVLELPWDVMQEEFEGNVADYQPVKGTRMAPDPQDVREAASVLLASRRPVVHAGQGVLYAEAWDGLRQLAELLQAPVMSTLSAKSVFPENHPLALGTGSHTTTRPVHHFLQKADVVFGIGCSFTRTVFGVEIPSGKVMIHSTNDAADINKDYRIDHALIGDARLVLAQLIEEVKRQAGSEDPSRGRKTAAEVKAVRDEWLQGWMPRLTSDEVPLNPYRIVWDLMHTVDRDNTIVTHDAGSPRDQMVPFYEATAPRSYIGWGKSTQLGCGLGLIMGAKLAAPDKVCINVMGDAAIGMVGMDFETAVRNRIPILSIVLNNGAMSIEAPTLPVATEKFRAKYLGGDYSQVARALGGYSERVEKPGEIVPAIRRAIEVTKGGQPALLEFVIKEEREFSSFS